MTIPLEEMGALWRNMLKEFPSDSIIRDIHLIRELRTAIKKRAEKVMSYREIGSIARKEFAEWLKTHGVKNGLDFFSGINRLLPRSPLHPK